jgi:predicted transcriptional regulator of viral defense system
MKGFTRFRQGVKAMLNDKYTLIDPFGDNVGEFVSKWRLRLNIPRDNLLGMIQKMY